MLSSGTTSGDRTLGVLRVSPTAMHAKVQASNRTTKANRASHCPRVRAQARVKKTRENPKENPEEPKVRTKVLKAHTRAEHRKLVSGLENSKSEASSETQESAQTCTTGNSWIHDGWSLDEWNDGWSCDEWNDDWSSVGLHEGFEQTYNNSASSFSLGGLDLGATSSPKRFEWAKMNLDTGAAVNTFPLNFGPEGTGDGRFYRTASGEWIPDGGAWQFQQGYDENGLLRSLNGRLIGVHKVLCSAAEKNRVQRTTGFLPRTRRWIHDSDLQQNWSRNEEPLREVGDWYGKEELIVVHLKNNIFNFYLSGEVKSTETNNVNEACLAKNCQQLGNGDGRAVRA